MIKLLYFAKLRERMGREEELVTPPPDVTTVADVMTWLANRDARSSEAFAQKTAIRAALDRVHVAHTTPIAGAKELAFFPPVTGG